MWKIKTNGRHLSSLINSATVSLLIVSILFGHVNSARATEFPDPMPGSDPRDKEMVAIKNDMISLQNRYCPIALKKCNIFPPIKDSVTGGEFFEQIGACMHDIIFSKDPNGVPNSCCKLVSFKKICGLDV